MRRGTSVYAVALFLVAFLADGVRGQTTWYVDENATGPTHDGTSWCSAYLHLRDALAVAIADDEIRVADGLYRPDRDTANPTGTGNRSSTFQLMSGVRMKGAYSGCGAPSPDARGVAANDTILSGDLAGDDSPVACTYGPSDCRAFGWQCVDGFCIISQNNGDNSYHVVTGSGTDDTAILDGFTISAGNANGSSPNDRGGGMVSDAGSPTITNCTFTGSVAFAGGGMQNSNSSNPTVTNCTFYGNRAVMGGGMENSSNSDPTVINCTFKRNDAVFGGGMAGWETGSPMVSNCTFSENVAHDFGGGMFHRSNSDATVTNCAFIGNSGRVGGGVHCNDSRPTLVNCTFTGNSGLDGGGMSNINFASPTLINCTFSRNTATFYEGGGVYNYFDSTPTLTNCILWGDTPTEIAIGVHGDNTSTVSFSNVQGGLPPGTIDGGGNIDVSPLFLDADGPDDIAGTQDDDLRLYPLSPCIDAGNNEAVTEDRADLDGDGDTTELVPFDLDRNPRFVDAPCMEDVGNPHPDFPDLDLIDMGAYEYQGLPDDDPDADGIIGCVDNCPLHGNVDQADCDGDELGDVCEIALGISRDCNNNGKPDDCDIADGTSPDEDQNGIPDECRPQPPQLPGPPHDTPKHRYLSIDPSTNAPNEVVIKVEVAEMRRCTEDTRRACLVDEDCDPVCANDLDKYCTSPDQCAGADCIATGPCVDMAPTHDPPLAWLVQEPEQQDDGEWTARLSDTAYREDWSTYTVLHIGDCPTVPCITYHVLACDPLNLYFCSEPLEIATQRFPALFPFKLYGDVAGGTVLPGPEVLPPDGYVNVADLMVTLLTIQNYGTLSKPQAHPTWVDLHGLGTGIPPNYILNVSDLQAVYVYSLTDGLPWINSQGGLDPGDCP
ncbi:MAG: right-handed parallel beta-helix repeat-containing protein [Planctomycetota bacterium]|jgi:hypothetical protein